MNVNFLFMDESCSEALDSKHTVISSLTNQRVRVVETSMAYTFADPDHSVGEERWLTFGMSRMGRVLAVIYTERRGKVRLISARVATKHERRIYEEN